MATPSATRKETKTQRTCTAADTMKRRDKTAIFILCSLLVASIAGAMLSAPLFPVEEPKTPDLKEMPILKQGREGTVPGAPVTIDAYIDYSCPHCSEMAPVLERVMAAYGPDVNVRIRHFPKGEDSLIAAQAAECAREQGRFWNYHRELLSHPLELKLANLYIYANEVELDSELFDACMQSGETLRIALLDLEEGEGRLVQGTPTVFINSWKLEGSKTYKDFKELIDAELFS